MKAVILIPARLESSRLERKMLADLEGEPLIVRTWRQAMHSTLAERVVVATDSREIASVLEERGAEVVMTSPTASCGTERIAEAARSIEGDVFVNLQGDEPLISPDTIDLVLSPFFTADPPDCSTLVFALGPDERAQIDDPHVVKALLDRNGNALYFSRSSVPFMRNHFPLSRCFIAMWGCMCSEGMCCSSLPHCHPQCWKRRSRLSSFGCWKTGSAFGVYQLQPISLASIPQQIWSWFGPFSGTGPAPDFSRQRSIMKEQVYSFFGVQVFAEVTIFPFFLTIVYPRSSVFL